MKPLLHQLETIDTLDKQFAQKDNKALVVLPSGAGKTHTVAFHVAKLKPKTFLYIVHRNEILNQTVKIFREICDLSNRDIGIIDSKHKEFTKPYLFATIQTLSNKKNLEKIRKDIEYMVIDEYHHVAADSYDKIITKHFTPKYLVGLTATPYRLDKLDIMKYIDGNIANDIDVFEGIERNILVPFEYIGLWDNIDYTQIRWSGHRYNVGDLDRKLIIHKRDEAVLEEYKNRIKDRLTIAFCNSVDHVHRITKKFNDQGIPAVGITYKEDPVTRQDILDDFRNGVYKVLFTRDILNEGVDFPECSAVMLLRPTISKTVFFQQIGRGLRKKAGKKNVIVLDYIGNYQRAFKKSDWLKMYKKEGETGEHIKPYYEYSPQIKIRFDQRVIEMMELQQRTYSKQDIIENYLYVKKMENVPSLGVNEYGRSKYRKYDKKIFTRRFGSFRDFLIEANLLDKSDQTIGIRKYPENFFKCDDKQKLIDNYWNIKKKWSEQGKTNYLRRITNCPSSKYFDKVEYSRYGIINYKRNWGTYTNFLVDIDEIDPENHTAKPKTEENIHVAIVRLQNKLGKKMFSVYEWEKEYGGYCRTMIGEMGGFNEFRKKFGVYHSKCLQCNEEFENRTVVKKFCSNICKRMYRKHKHRRSK